MNYFSKKSLGGVINSKISNQESTGSIYALEVLNNNFITGFTSNNFEIRCEQEEDLSIVDDNQHIYIQVKSGKLSKKDIIAILDNFKEIDTNVSSKKSVYVLTVFEKVILETRDFTDRFQEYRTYLNNNFNLPEEVLKKKEEILQAFKLSKYADLLDNFYIDYRPMLRDSKDTLAIFNTELRSAYKILNINVDTAEEIFEKICNRLAYSRRTRASISIENIEKIISIFLSETLFLDAKLKISPYIKKNCGYIVDAKLEKKVRNLSVTSRKVERKLFSLWRKEFRKEAIISMIIGSKYCCPECNHPLIANFGGLNGLQCPDCKYTMFLSLYLFCECGEYYLIKEQPKLEAYEIFKEINQFQRIREISKCKNCDVPIFDEYLSFKFLLVPLPGNPQNAVIPKNAQYKYRNSSSVE